MCCSTGICGPKVDPVLPTFAADLAWLKDQGVTVERYNLAQQPQAFVSHDGREGRAPREPRPALPLVRVNGHIVSKGSLPVAVRCSPRWCGVSLLTPLTVTEPVTASCCGPTGCC